MDVETAKKIVKEMEDRGKESPERRTDFQPIDLNVEAIRVRDPETRDPHLLKRRVTG